MQSHREVVESAKLKLPRYLADTKKGEENLFTLAIKETPLIT